MENIFDSIKNELKVDQNGVGYCSIRGAARLAWVSDPTLSRHFSRGAVFSGSKLAKTLTDKGFRVLSFANNGIPDMALAVILFYYAFEAGSHCTEQAQSAYHSFASTGIRAVIQDVCGHNRAIVGTQSLSSHQAEFDRIDSKILRIEEDRVKMSETISQLEATLAQAIELLSSAMQVPNAMGAISTYPTKVKADRKDLLTVISLFQESRHQYQAGYEDAAEELRSQAANLLAFASQDATQPIVSPLAQIVKTVHQPIEEIVPIDEEPDPQPGIDMMSFVPVVPLPFPTSFYFSEAEIATCEWFYIWRSQATNWTQPTVTTREGLLYHVYGLREGRATTRSYCFKPVEENIGKRVRRMIALLAKKASDLE